MARKIKLPLDMGNDIKVRDIDELKENYNSEKVVEYFLSGELLSWLNDRFYDEEAERVEALSADKGSVNVAGKLAEIFNVQIEGEVDVDEIAERKERLERLRKITSDDEILHNVDLVAFSQEDMDIVHESDVIYLCGDKFRIPYSVQNKRYIGVNDPLVEISAKGDIDLDSKGIVIEGCRFTEETEARLINQKPAEVNEPQRHYGASPVVIGATGDDSSFEKVELTPEFYDKLGLAETERIPLFPMETLFSIASLDTSPSKPAAPTVDLSVTFKECYKNKDIYISTNLIKKTKRVISVRFENCKIHIPQFIGYGSNDHRFTLFKPARLDFINCSFIGENDEYTDLSEEGYLINSYNEVPLTINFSNCLFERIDQMIRVSSKNNDLHFHFNKCKFVNCFSNLLYDCDEWGNYFHYSHANAVNISDCEILQDIDDPKYMKKSNRIRLFNIHGNRIVDYAGRAAIAGIKPYDVKKEDELNKNNPGDWVVVEHNLILQPKGYTVEVFKSREFPEIPESFYAAPSDKAAIERFWQEVK